MLNFKTLASMHGSKDYGGIKSVIDRHMDIRMDRQAKSNIPEVFRQFVYSWRPENFHPYAATQKEDQKLVFKTNYRLMQVKSIAECSKRAFCNTFDLH